MTSPNKKSSDKKISFIFLLYNVAAGIFSGQDYVLNPYSNLEEQGLDCLAHMLMATYILIRHLFQYDNSFTFAFANICLAFNGLRESQTTLYTVDDSRSCANSVLNAIDTGNHFANMSVLLNDISAKR